MKYIYLISLIAITACGEVRKPGGSSKLDRMNYFLGFWQNVDNPTNFLLFSYAMDNVEEGLCSWGTFPLLPLASDPSLIDTAAYNKNFVFMGGVKIEGEKISCWYKDMDRQEVKLEGEIKILSENTISTPVGVFKKLTNEEVDKINPNLK